MKYLPVEAGEFERLLEALQRTAPGAPAQTSVGLVEAQYEARLTNQSLLQGSATLNVSQSIASSMLMTFDPCNLAITRAQWVTSDGAPAVLGATGDGRLQLLAERSGQMKFDWSLAGQRDPAGGASFSIALPPSPVNRLRIELPVELAPAIDHGIATDEGPVDPAIHRWRIDLGGWPGCRLRLAKAGGAVVRPPSVLASQSTAYDFSLRGLELAIKLSVDAQREPLRKLVLALDPALDLVEVSAGDVSLAWTTLASHGDKPRQIAIDVPASLAQVAMPLRLRAIAPLSMPESWRLPRVTVEGAAYRSNTIRLSVPSPLYIEHLETHGCRQTGASPMKTTAGEQMDFENIGTDASVEVSLSQRPTQIQTLSVTATELGQGKMSSRVATDFRTSTGPVFSLEADVLPNWIIDSVESKPTDGLDDWTLDRSGGARKLSIRLAQPLSPSRPLRLIVSARRLYASPGRNLGIDDLVPLRFCGLSESKRWLALRALGSNKLQFTAGDNLQRVDTKDLTPAELDLFAGPPGDLLFRDDLGAASLRLSLENRRRAYSAAIRVEAVVGDASLAENYSFACTPSKAAPIDRAVVHFTGYREVPLNWSVVGMDASRFSARRWSESQKSAAGLTTDEETWDVVFRSPQSAPLEIRASRKMNLIGPTPVNLAWLPDAASQEATLVVRSLGPQNVKIENNRLKPLPFESGPSGQVQTVRASYQFDPQSEAVPQPKPAIVLTATEGPSATAWTWDCEVRSKFAADGAGNHVVSYRIQNAGSRQIRLKLPDPLSHRDIHGIWINDKPAVALRSVESAADEVIVDLPADVKFVTLDMRIATQGKPLGIFTCLRPPLPEVGLPVFVRRWRLELPPGYTAVDSSQDSQAGESTTFSLRRRLLGGLGRGENQSAFNPLRLENWKAMFQTSAREDRPADAKSDAELVGWTQVSIDLADSNSRVIVVRRAAIDASGWIFFLAVVGVGAWCLSGRPLTLLLLAAIFGLSALLLPPAIAVVFSHGLLGVLFSLATVLVRRRIPLTETTACEDHREMPSTLTNIVPFGAPLLAAMMFLAGDCANADEATKSPLTYSVFIPVDAKQQATQGKYFLPEPFYAELYRRTALHAEKPQGWMITSAIYRAALADDATQGAHVVDRLNAEFEIHVFNTAARVRIPLRRDEVSLEPGQAQLDGRSVQPEWDSDGSALFLEISEPGEYHLELALRPSLQPGNRSAGFDLAIPRVPDARFELNVPAGGPQIEFPSALGAVRWDEVQSRWTTELGPAGRLAARWQDTTPSVAATAVDVEQLLWLKIEPGCVLLDVRMKVKAVDGRLHRLLVRAGSDLELLPSTALTSPAVQSRGGDSIQTYEIQWPQAVGPAATFDLHFLWSGQSSLGTFHVPQIDVVDARPARRSMAISIDPAFDYSVPGARLHETGVLPEFISNWGGSDTPPESAFRLNDSAADWTLTTRPRRIETAGDQHVTWSFSAQSAELQCDAQLTTTGGNLFQYRLEVPPLLRVDSISILAEDVNQAVRWSQDPSGHIAIFFAGPISGRHELRLHGQMKLSQKRKLALPQVHLDDVRIQSSRVSLYRRPDVLLEVSGVADAANVMTNADDGRAMDLGRPVRSFYADPTAVSPVLVTINENHPAVHAEQVMRIAGEENQWRVTWQCNLQVSQGLLDTVEIDVPAAWKDGFKISPTMAATLSAVSDDHARLVLSPSSAIASDETITLTGPPTATMRFAVPNIALRRLENVRKYVVLPNSADHRPVDWNLQNLRRCDSKIAASDDTKTYEIIGEPWQAALQLPRQTTSKARIVHADVRYAWQADGRCLGIALFDLEPAGAIDSPLELPPGFELLQLTVDGLPVDAVRGEAGIWTVPLASHASASRVELLFFGESAIPSAPIGWSRRCLFRAPKLGNLPVEGTVWTIAAPGALQAAIADIGNVQSPISADAAKPGDFLAQWQRFVDENQATVSCVTGDQVDAIAIDYRPQEARSWLSHLLSSVGLLLVVGLAALSIRRRLWWNWFDRRPYVFGVGIGLIWWLWLSPSALGLLIVLAVLFRQFFPWPRFFRTTTA
jgi:hypothetical protein